MRKKFELITAVSFSLIIILFGIMFFAFPDKNVSEIENRSLQTLPRFSFKSLFDTTYISKLEDYFTDQFPLRSSFINLKTNVSKLLFKDEVNNVYFADDYLIEKYNELEIKDSIVDVLNEFSSKINYVNLNLMLAPTSTSVNSEKLPNTLIMDSELDDINYIYDKIKFNKIKIYDELNNSEYQTFYKTDHHWTSYGAYLAYLKYASMNNIESIKIQDFKIEEVTNSFCGTYCSKSGDFNHLNDSIHTFTYKDYDLDVKYVGSDVVTKSLYNKDYLNKKDKYSMFLDNNHPLIIITNNDIISASEIVVIKDSYANSFIPFLVNHFKRVHVIDPRYYKLSISDYILNNKKIKDALILYNMGTIGSDTGILSIE